MKNARKILLLCTAAPGGMRAVVDGYRRDGVFDRWNVDLVYTHEFGTASLKLLRVIGGFSYVLRQLIKRQVALMHCHMSMRASFWRKSLFASLARLFGVPVILHLHGSQFEAFYDSLPKFGKWLVMRQFTLANAVFVLSESWKTFILSAAPKANVVVLPNYVEMPNQPMVETKKHTRLNILFLGVIGDRKGVYDLLPAFSAAIKTQPELHLRIGGNGEVDKAILLSQKLQLEDHVEFLGWVSGDKKDELLGDADIFVLPSYNEGLPVSILEAMSWGVPVITTTVGGIPELITDGVTGYLITPGDQLRLQQLLESLAQDASLRKAIGSNGRLVVMEKYSRSVVLPQLESIYSNIIDK
jgi:glycosyltransferase involved in cell wall biosynthesis